MPTTTLTVGGVLQTFSQYNAWPIRLTRRYRGFSTLAIRQTGGPLVALPEKWLGKPVELAIDGTVQFAGDVTDVEWSFTGKGWTPTYQCRDLRWRADRIPMTDENTGTDSAAYNLQADDRDWIASRAGRTVGEIVEDVLTGDTNAHALDAKGLGAYTSLSPPTLPAATAADLALLTLVPPTPVYVQGERLLSAIEAFLSVWAPNHVIWIDPVDGKFRVVSLDDFTASTLTMDVDPIDPPGLRRSVAECFPRVVVRGSPLVEPKMVTLGSGGLAEDFAWGSYATNAAAKAAWVPADFERDSDAKSEGTCSCTDTLNVVVNPTDNTQAWAADYWDQTGTGHLGSIYLYFAAGAGIDQFVSRRIVSNAALSANSTANVTVDLALPATNYDHFQIYGISSGASLVWRKYKVVDNTVASKMVRQFSWPVPYIGASGNVAVMTTMPMGSVLWSNTGSPPYAEFPDPFVSDPGTGTVIFQLPTYKVAGNKVPSDVRCMLAVNVGVNTAVKPDDVGGSPAYEGTSNTVEGLEDTLTVTVPTWRDPANAASMLVYAQDLLDSVKSTTVEGTVVYHGYYADALDFGRSITLAGSTYATPYDGIAIPIQEVELHWNSAQGPTRWTTVMHLSNRRQHFSSAAFLRPDRPESGALVGAGLEGVAGELAANAGYNTSGVFQGLSPEQARQMPTDTQTHGGVDPLASLVADTTGPAVSPEGP